MPLTRQRVADIIKRLKEVVEKEDCWTCGSLQGLVVQLELNADEDVSDITGPLKVHRNDMHPSLGCDPCQSGLLFAEYLKSCN